MPNKKSSYANLFRDWEGLMEACMANQANLPGVDEAVAQIAEALIQVKTLKLIRQTFATMAQETTVGIQEARDNGRESARRLRYFVKSRLGTRSEQLPQFGIAPARVRPKAKRQKTG